MAALRWIDMLLQKQAQEMNKFIGELLPALLKTLSDDSDDVVLMALKVLARISLHEAQFQRVLNDVIALFATDRRLLETRGSLIIRRLCVLLNAKSIYISLAAVLRASPDPEFASIMVQTLNLILLTALELGELRTVLKRSFQPSASGEDREVFTQLFTCCCHNPVATLSLCLLAQAYDLSACLVQKFAEVEITVGFLMQIDKLVQLLESPVFVQLRLQLLEVDANYHAPLLKSLYGLLMLLPQSTAFKTLKDRLATVSSLQHHLAAPAATNAKKENFDAILATFERVQERHARARQEALQSRSLKPDDK
jgi:vacuole morphology and inheritance protein 14